MRWPAAVITLVGAAVVAGIAASTAAVITLAGAAVVADIAVITAAVIALADAAVVAGIVAIAVAVITRAGAAGVVGSVVAAAVVIVLTGATAMQGGPPLDQGQGIAVGVIADADREQDAMLRSVLDGYGGCEAGAVRWEDGNKAVVGAMVVGGTGVVVGEDGGRGIGVGFGEAALEGGDMGVVLRRPRSGLGEGFVEGGVEAIPGGTGSGHDVEVGAIPSAWGGDGRRRSGG